ncbi:hypothetical protein [Clostridium tagluense]|uniref:hypothetical protein n=1 Tax=Clostridium tagluense TaxID=360422 RepID=UPI001C6DEBA5|nr:hypothetical protein [Clostridium tagluense]MBW9158686.1 hypothetical protein [Clostridium tagluense]WLC68176.1 hypothetical protein KTC93_23730 [Clostridium tagluense]
MLRSKKNLSIIITTLFLASVPVSSITAFASNQANTDDSITITQNMGLVDKSLRTGKIPGEMAPCTIIEYQNNSQYKIIQGSEYNHKIVKTNLPVTFDIKLSAEDIKRNEDYKNFLKEHEEELKPKNIIKVENPEPCTGMKIIYDGEGFIKHIQMPEKIHDLNKSGIKLDDVEKIIGISYASKILDRGTTSPVGTYSWGDNKNTLTVTKSLVRGVGRLTNFTDVKGEAENPLVKGDVATKRDKDNPKHGQTLTVNANGKTKSMYKNDNGDLPDAVLDVWKTGVEFFGYKWNVNLSFKGEYSYIR